MDAMYEKKLRVPMIVRMYENFFIGKKSFTGSHTVRIANYRYSTSSYVDMHMCYRLIREYCYSPGYRRGYIVKHQRPREL